MAFEDAQLAPRVGVPESHGAIVAGTGEATSVGGKGHAPDQIAMAFEDAQLSPRNGVPETHVASAAP